MSTDTEKTTKVTLAKDGLTVDGKERAKGDEIYVTDAQMAFLTKRGYLVDANKAGGKAPAPETK